MASITTNAVPPPQEPEATGTNAAPRGGYRGRGGARGGSRATGSRRPRGERGNGGGGKTDGDRRGQHNRPQDGTSSAVPVEQAVPPARTTSIVRVPSGPETATIAALDSESVVCFICADPVIYSAIAPCNHVTCHICALRMRALYKNKACAHCRTEAEWVVFSKLDNKPFLDFKKTDIVGQNDALGIRYDDKTIFDDTQLLLHYNCPEESCDEALRGWPDLHRHVRTAHSKLLCDLCSRNKKVFTHEHTLFTAIDLRKHERTGDDQPGSENQSGFKGHPECGFCRQRFYSSDELYTHCRDKHERCHICDRRSPQATQQYYINYDALAVHFTKEHFMCADEECHEKKFVVFENEVDLKAHLLEVHPNGLSKNARRDVRRIDLSAFAPDRHAQDRSRRRRNDGRGQQEREEPPIRTEQQMSRAELAYHRTLAVQSAQSTTSRNFGGQLTEPAFVPRPPPPRAPPPPAVRPVHSMTTAVQPPVRPPARPAEAPAVVVVAPAAAVPAVVAQVAFPPLVPVRTPTETAGPSGARGGPQTTEDARRLKHTAVIERALVLLHNNESKLGTFKTDISKYRQGHLTASNLVDRFWALFDAKTPELGVLIKELAELFEDEQKRRELLRAWNDWKAINEDYPPFAGASSSSSAVATGSKNSSHVLKVKSSTSHSARSTTARQGAWGAAAAAPPPPPVAMAPVRSANRKGPGAHAPTPWVAPSAAPAAGEGPVKRSGGDEFPSLPMKTPPPPGWGPIRKKDPYSAYNGAPVPQAPVWGAGGSGGEWSEEPSESEGPSGEQGGKKKGKKQLLFHVGL